MSETPALQQPAAARALYYYVILDGESVGPLSATEIAELVGAGRVRATTRAWHEELDHWIEIGRMPELVQAIPALAGYELAPSAEAPVARDIQLAGFGRRAAAGLVDTLLFWAIVGPLFALVPPLSDLWVDSMHSDAMFNLTNLIIASLAALYYVPPLWLGRGQTVGYLVLRIRLVDEHTLGGVSFGRILLWYLALAVQFVGWIWYFHDKRQRMLHNIVSRTIVVGAPGT